MKTKSRLLALFLIITFAFVLSGVAQQQTEEKVMCSVCGKEINKADAKFTYESEGKTYYFCCEKCKEKFMEKAEKSSLKKEHMQVKMHKDEKSEKKACCPMMELMMSKDVEMNIENLKDGIAVKITSKTEEMAKKIQEMASQMKAQCKHKEKSSKEVDKEKKTDK